jgi:hypothetical protein
VVGIINRAWFNHGEILVNIENHVIDILIIIARLSPHYDEVSLEDGFIEIDLDTGNEQPPDTKIAAAILVEKFIEGLLRT